MIKHSSRFTRLVSLALPLIFLICSPLSACCSSQSQTKAADMNTTKASSPTLGNFSISLAVKDLAASREFYENLGFKSVGGDGNGYLIMQNDTATIGLFQGMFEKNILTFNPGWDRNTNTLTHFEDVRQIQRTLIARGLKPTTLADESTTTPASLTITDPDGNMILLDQHVPSPTSPKK